jgi:type VI secretion system secreted protein VgrG
MPYRTILSAQSFLKWLGYNPGPVDNRDGPLTCAAWNEFLDDAENKKLNLLWPHLSVVLDKAKIKPDASPAAAVLPPPTPTDRFHEFIIFILQRECAYARGSKERIPEDVVVENVPGDSGGLTKFGIDQASHPNVRISTLTLAQAEEIYFSEWQKHRCDELLPPIGEIVFDAFVTGGQPIIWLQRALNAVDGEKIVADGHIGPMTISAVEVMQNKKAIGNKMLEYRDAYFTSLGEKYPHDRKFVPGWLNRDKELRDWITQKLSGIT